MEDRHAIKSTTAEAQLDQCEYLFLRHLHEPQENLLRFVVEEAKAQRHLTRQTDPSKNDALAEILRDASPILSDSSSRSFEVIFDTYVSYAVTNELYGRYPEPPQIFSGSRFRRFHWSHLLEFTGKTTQASDAYPGPLVHYQVVCENHVIDVISTIEPHVRVLNLLSDLRTVN